MSRMDLLPSICLSALLAASAGGTAVAAGPLQQPALLPALTVINQKPEDAGADAAANSPAADAGFALDIKVGAVETVNSSMTGAELTRVFSGDIAAEADKLTALDATSIRVPNIKFTMTMPAGKDRSADTFVYDYKDIDIESVSNGLAQSVTIGSMDGAVNSTAGSPKTVHFELGKMTANDVDIGAMLGFYGYGPDAAATTMKPLYKNFVLAGGDFSAENGNCSFGAVKSASFSARPLKLSFGDLMKLVASSEMQQPNPPPEFINKLVLFYADFFSAIQSSPATLDGIDCAGKDEHGQAFTLKNGTISVDGFGNDRYPAVTMQNFAYAGSDGRMSLASATMKGMDLSAPIQLIESAAKPLTEAWFTDNARKLIPAFEGFALSGLDIDVPDTQNAGERIKGGIGDFDLTLGDYQDGIPMRVSTSAHHVAFDVPPAVAGKPDDYDVLRQMGINRLDVGYDFAMHHDSASKSLIVDKLGVTGVDLGTAVLAATLGNVDGVLFAKDTDSATAAAMAMTFQSAKLDLTDAGLGDIIFKEVAKEQHMDAAAARTSVSNMAQGLILAGLASNPDAKALGEAVGQFLAAAGRSLSIGVSAKNPAGLAMSDFAAASDNPQALAGKVSISAIAK